MGGWFNIAFRLIQVCLGVGFCWNRSSLNGKMRGGRVWEVGRGDGCEEGNSFLVYLLLIPLISFFLAVLEFGNSLFSFLKN